jgi:hypothetical protein
VDPKMKKTEDELPNRSTGNPAKASRAEHCTQVALDVADMPENLGRLLDKGFEDHFHGR